MPPFIYLSILPFMPENEGKFLKIPRAVYFLLYYSNVLLTTSETLRENISTNNSHPSR